MKALVDGISVSVVMPCLNEENDIAEALNSTINAFKEYNLIGEVIVIDDGSVDNTKNIAQEYARLNKSVRVISNTSNMGIGASFMKGVEHAKHNSIIMIPGDNENDPLDALRYISLINSVDIIVPFVQNVEIRSIFRRVVSSAYRFIVNISFGMNLNYTNGTVIYNSNVIKQLKTVSPGFFYQAEILIRLIRQGYLYAETPHILSKRGAGKTKAISLKSLANVIVSYVKLFVDVHIFKSKGMTEAKIIKSSATFKRLSGGMSD